MRRMGLRAGDLDDERGYWTAERRKVDATPRDSVVIIGDSRILFDTDLATWQRLTGRRPIQLALMGAGAQPILHDLANDEHFAGLLVIGTAELSYFSEGQDSTSEVLEYIKTESPSQRVGHQIYKGLSRYYAFLDSNYTLFDLLERHKLAERKDVQDPYTDVWKVGEFYDGRQGYLWEQVEREDYIRRHAQSVWMEIFSGPPATAEQIDRVIANTKPDVDRIRARGGEVVWIRPPSSGPILDIEHTRYPRSKVWDKLMQGTGSFGVYFDDYPSIQHLNCPDWSHLSKSSVPTFTDTYVRVLEEHVGWLGARVTSGAAGAPLNARLRSDTRK
jgi:hypothetical protein